MLDQTAIVRRKPVWQWSVSTYRTHLNLNQSLQARKTRAFRSISNFGSFQYSYDGKYYTKKILWQLIRICHYRSDESYYVIANLNPLPRWAKLHYYTTLQQLTIKPQTAQLMSEEIYQMQLWFLLIGSIDCRHGLCTPEHHKSEKRLKISGA